MRIFSKRAQSTLEYSILFSIIVAAAVAMQVYIKRGLGGGIKYGVDKMVKSDTRKQYEPYYLESYFTVKNKGTTDTELMEGGGKTTRTFGQKEVNRDGYQKTRVSPP